MSAPQNNQTVRQTAPASTASYVIGFVLSLALTLTAYLLVRTHINHHHLYPSDTFMVIMLPVLAVAQLFTQLVFFLHLGKGSKPRWNPLVLSFALIVVLILVIGSLWIMHNLNYRMMPSGDQVNQYLKNQNGGI